MLRRLRKQNVRNRVNNMYAPRLIHSQPNSVHAIHINPLTPNAHYSGHTAPLTSKSCILYIYSTNIGNAYFKQGIYSPFIFSSKCSLFHNSNVFGSCIIHILYAVCAKIKKTINPLTPNDPYKGRYAGIIFF